MQSSTIAQAPAMLDQKGSSTVLRIPQELYEARLNRMHKLIALRAPAIIIRNEAKILLKSFQPLTWRERLGTWRLEKWPYFLLWLTSKELRAAVKTYDTPSPDELEMMAQMELELVTEELDKKK